MPTNPFGRFSSDDKTAVAIASVDLLKLPAAKIYANVLTPTDHAFINANTQAKTAIAIALVTQEIENWNMLSTLCNDRITCWKAKLAELEILRNLLHESRTGSLQVLCVRSRSSSTRSRCGKANSSCC
jgi:hypothetical protein